LVVVKSMKGKAVHERSCQTSDINLGNLKYEVNGSVITLYYAPTFSYNIVPVQNLFPEIEVSHIVILHFSLKF
jgi:hypothetical protein